MKTSEHILQLFDNACNSYPGNIAFSGLGQELIYADLQRLSMDFARFLQSQGLQPGERIAMQMPNLLQYPIAIFGALRAGLVVVNTNPLYTPRELRHQFTDAGVSALVVVDGLLASTREVIAESGIRKVVVATPLELQPLLSEGHGGAVSASVSSVMAADNTIEWFNFDEALRRGADLPWQPVAIAAHDLAMLQYTGGTTGVAKGAMLTHANLVANRHQVVEHCAKIFREGQEITVCPLPLYHIYAFTVTCLAMVSRGCHSVLIANPRDLPSLVREIRPYPITGFVGINTLFNALLHNEEFRNLDLSSLNSTTSGGMALNTEIARAWKELTGIQIAEGYGLTETAPVVLSNPPGRVHPGTVGLAVPGTELKVIDEAGVDLGLEAVGELCVRGPQVMKGYWQRPEATAEVLSVDGWLRTGDMALIQTDGYVRIVDRKKDMIVVSGFNVYPNEVEDVACQHPQVVECAAIGVADEDSGEAVKLYVVAEPGGLNADELKTYLRTQLTGYKIPKFIEQIDALPKSNVGKILRRELR
ncbi:AMP-binding protein [Pseudomaricurvus sp. HS19]|uniref:AMP-binding protein n=1 Tax=Pseudomaricurvus sp. HS19 TaxID=2692626 RepID=UPI001369C8CA|nr:AMP-binding protein [Pseudomaricurvus sp. HS19]MYM64419.1 AMP-binding protein [Pseudomaricurvus sp. HS19]